MGNIVLGTSVRLGLPDGWMVVPRPLGLAGVSPMPEVPGLIEVEDLDLVGPSDATVTVEAEDTEGILVLIERDGLLSWHLPELGPEDEPKTVLVPVTPALEGPAGLRGEGIVARIRAVVYRFAAEALAGLAARAVVAVLEGRRAEGPVHIVASDPDLWLTSAGLGHLADLQPRRLLLLLHGTFSSTRGSFAGMADELGVLAGRYDLVLGFDHHTLGRSPSENAERIASVLLEAGWAPEHVDVIAYSRGGLVARALLHKRLPPAWREAVRSVLYLACPNAGTPLAAPARWTALLDRTTNLAAALLSLARLNPAWTVAAAALDEVLAGMGVLLRALATRALSPADVPGLAAMDPTGGWLRELGDAHLPGVRYLGLAASHEPQGALARLGDGTVDVFMEQDNDLVVPTASVQLAVQSFEMEVLQDQQVHHFTLVRAVAPRVPELLRISIASPLGLLELPPTPVAPLGEEGGRAAAAAAVRAALALHPRGLPDDVAERLLALEALFPGVLEEVHASNVALAEAGAPPDRFSSDAEGRTLRRTVRDRFGYQTEAVAPTTVGQLWAALASGGALRVAGSARSLSQVSDPTESRLVGTHGLGERWLEPPPLVASQDERGLYWCGAGRTLRGVIGDLVEERRAIANIGSGSFQTLAGAFSSGTHGSGLGLGALHTQIAALAVLTFAGGRPVVRFVERADQPVCDPAAFPAWAARWALREGLPPQVVELVSSDERFQAHVMGLGCLGVVVGVALRVMPEYLLVESRQPTTWKLARHDLLERARRARHFELILDPWPAPSGDHRCLVIERDLATESEDDGKRPLGMWLATEGIARGTAGLLMESAIRDPLDRLPRRVNTSIEQTIVARYVARWDQVLRLNLNVASLTGEYGVPASGAVEAIDALLGLCRSQIASARAYMAAHPSDTLGMWQRHPVPGGPIAVRFVAADDVHLSPMNGRPSAMLEFHHPGSWELDACMVSQGPGDDGGRARRYRAYHEGRKRLMAEAERLLEAQHAGRAHWGLYHTLDGARAQAVYPGFARWRSIYEEANAAGVFNGRITAALGLNRP
jgi:hypothetical protein